MTRNGVDKWKFLSLLFQLGYLSIKEAKYTNNDYLYTLGYTNLETQKTLNEILIPLYLGEASEIFLSSDCLNLFASGKTGEALEILKQCYKSVPYQILKNNSEDIYHASFHSMMHILGADIHSEVSTSDGRIDSVLEFEERVYIIEFKYAKTAGEALEQIKTMGYEKPYLAKGKAVHLLGINFSRRKRNIADWKEEVL